MGCHLRQLYGQLLQVSDFANQGVAVMQAGGQAWFGGGCDLTPAYIFDEDATRFHVYWRDLCNRHGTPQLYEEYKVSFVTPPF